MPYFQQPASILGVAIDRVILIVLDSVGCGAARDAFRFNDEGAHTLKHISEWAEKNKFKFDLPNLSRWGLWQIYKGYGINGDTSESATAVLEELSPGKDTTTGHWELAGQVLKKEFPLFPNGFDQSLMQKWVSENKLNGFLCNKPASGTVVLDDFGEEHISSLKPIVYTSGDSVFQVACSEEAFGLDKLYEICKSARKLLDPLGVGRVIARPFVGQKRGEFKRTENRRDFSVEPAFPNLLDILKERSLVVGGVGKIEDIFAHRGLTLVDHTGRNETSLEATLKMMKDTSSKRGLIFTNLIDYDQLYGHRRNPQGYAEALMAFDRFLPKIENEAKDSDLVVLVADHGNDPTHQGTDHTREDVPLLFWSKNLGFRPKHFGKLKGFNVVAKLVLEALGLESEISRLPDLIQAESLIESSWK